MLQHLLLFNKVIIFGFSSEISSTLRYILFYLIGPDEEGQPCGVHYFLKTFIGENDTDRTHKRSTVSMAIRKVQYAPSKQGRQPCTVVRKDFMLSPGDLELEVTLDKQVHFLYYILYIISNNTVINRDAFKHLVKILR